MMQLYHRHNIRSNLEFAETAAAADVVPGHMQLCSTMFPLETFSGFHGLLWEWKNLASRETYDALMRKKKISKHWMVLLMELRRGARLGIFHLQKNGWQSKRNGLFEAPYLHVEIECIAGRR